MNLLRILLRKHLGLEEKCAICGDPIKDSEKVVGLRVGKWKVGIYSGIFLGSGDLFHKYCISEVDICE